MKKTLLSGMQATHSLTLGNYLGALTHWVQLQSQYDCLFLVVDLHSITTKHDPKELREKTYTNLAIYIAAGIDPKQVILAAQSHIPEHAELAWVLTCNTAMGELSRMTQFKDKSQKAGEHIPAGLFLYPVLMAADILLYQTDLVPVGADQKQHLELARDLAGRINHLYGKDLFRIPDPFIPKVGARIMSLQDPTRKMSKSDPDPHATLFVLDTEKQTEKKFKRAVTDSGSEVRYSDTQPGVKNLIDIQCALSGETPEQVTARYVGKQYGHLKVETASMVNDKLRPVREETERLLSDRSELDRILKEGAEKARARAQKTLRTLYDSLGLVKPAP